MLRGVTTYYVGNYYELREEVSGETTLETEVMYYHGGTGRFAMRTKTALTNELHWIFSDHLQSSSVILEEDGGDLYSKTLYTAFGEERDIDTTDLSDSPTDYQYTGQRSYMDDFGLHYYVARWYDPVTAHFVQADSLIPQPGNSADWNRYAYVNYNPINFNDPNGHFPVIAISLLVVGGLLFFSTTSDAIDPVPQTPEEQKQEAIQAGLGFTIMTLGLLPPATQVQIGTGIMADGDPTNEISAGIEVADDVAEATTNLYRAVGQNEMSDILQNNIIRPNPNSLSMWDKWFWQSYESATNWVELTKKAGYDYVGIVEVEVQAAILELGRQVPNQDTCGPAVVFAMEVLDDFNNAIIGIVEHTIQ